MKQSKLVPFLGLASILIASGFGHEVVAQARLQTGGNAANFGRSRLTTGFSPDPRRVAITTTGTIDARGLGLGSGCVGFVTARPDHIVTLTGASTLLRFYATVAAAAPATATDVTLLINDANNQWHCNDDSYGGANPTVNIPNAGPGQYDIWVGSYNAGTRARASLQITELDANHP